MEQVPRFNRGQCMEGQKELISESVKQLISFLLINQLTSQLINSN
jgi:hypothetical protein